MTVFPLRVNGGEYPVDAPAGAYLLDVLRDELGLQGTKEACAEGECGACTVLIDGEPVDSCIYFAGQAVGHEITTIEGIAGAGGHRVQQAFADAGAVQCGFCTPGFVVAATALLERTPHPDAGSVRAALAGNLCRCTGYDAIVAAVLAAAGGQP